jgi:hypothetical protein
MSLYSIDYPNAIKFVQIILSYSLTKHVQKQVKINCKKISCKKNCKIELDIVTNNNISLFVGSQFYTIYKHINWRF